MSQGLKTFILWFVYCQMLAIMGVVFANLPWLQVETCVLFFSVFITAITVGSQNKD